MLRKVKNKMSQAQIIALGYFLVIAAGTVLLLLPISTETGKSTGFLTALFTATSATCAASGPSARFCRM